MVVVLSRHRGSSALYQKRGRLTGLVALAGLLALPLCAPAEPGVPHDDDVVAKVNGTPIHRKSVRELVQAVLITQTEKPGPEVIDRLVQESLTSLIDHELLFQESQAEKIDIGKAAVDADIARTRERFPDEASFRAALRDRGISNQDLREETRKTLAVNRLLEAKVWRNVSVSDEDVKRFYERNKEEFRHPDEIRARHILVRVPEDADAATRAKARARAESLLARIEAGADFATIARQDSEDPGTAARGGDLGYFARGDMVESFEQHAFALQPGKRSGVVETVYGYHIIEVTDRRQAGYRPLAEVEDRIREVLAKTEREKLRAQLIHSLRQKADIQIRDD
jgi:peptidyl-prolyl cis-trans isomerase C